MQQAADLDLARYNMIEQQIRPWEVLDERVLGVMGELPRELFVPQGWQHLAYADTEIPLGHGHHMMAPKVEARLMQALELEPSDRVLEIGTGSGYLAACLSRLARQVDSVEIHADFSARAGAHLHALGIDNVIRHTGDAAHGWGGEKRFDAIAVTASMPVYHEGFERALRIGGRLFVVIGQAPVMEAMLVRRLGEDEFAREFLFETAIEPLDGLLPPAEFRF